MNLKAMIVGILQVELSIAWAESLKDKRSVVQRIKSRLHREHQVAVAEVATQENHRTATLGVVLASTSVAHAQQMIDGVLNKLRDTRDCVLADHRTEILSGY